MIRYILTVCSLVLFSKYETSLGLMSLEARVMNNEKAKMLLNIL